MLPRDFEGNTEDDAKAYLKELREWTEKQANLRDAQARARAELDAATARLGMITGWAAQLFSLLTELSLRRMAYDDCVADIGGIGPALGDVDNLIADRTESFTVATSRLLGDIPTTIPLVLLPLRVETHWTDEELWVRIFPDEIGVDSHDERVPAAEQLAGERYWQAVMAAAAGDAGAAQRLQAWEELARQLGPARAAWVARATDPAHGGFTGTPKSGWDISVSAPLLPDRFAVLAITDQRLQAANGGERQFVTWGAEIPATLSYDVLVEPGTTSWLTDFETAESVGMAVRVPISPRGAPIESLLVIGIRSYGLPTAEIAIPMPPERWSPMRRHPSRGVQQISLR